MGSVYVFVSNRGGSGKSTLVAQLAPAVAIGNPDKSVLVLDMSIQSDSSVILLGGTQAPLAYTLGIRTAGQQSIESIPSEKRALGFIKAAFAPPTPVARSFWRGTTTTATTNTGAAAVFDFKNYSVQATTLNPAMPNNLWIAAGHHELHSFTEINQAIPIATKLREAFKTMTNTIVLIDSDAEISERVSSLVGIAAATKIVIVASPFWNDYGRLLDDRANGIFSCLDYLTTNDSSFSGKISTFIFNRVSKRVNDTASIVGAAIVPFTPPNDELAGMDDIVNHLYSISVDPNQNYKRFFANQTTTAFEGAHAFVTTFVTAMATVPATVMQHCIDQGQPVVSTTKISAPQAQACSNLQYIAMRF